jgi:hypothetical protein
MFRMPKKEIFGDAHLAGVPDSVHFAACKASGNALTKGMPIYGTYAATKAALRSYVRTWKLTSRVVLDFNGEAHNEPKAVSSWGSGSSSGKIYGKDPRKWLAK